MHIQFIAGFLIPNEPLQSFPSPIFLLCAYAVSCICRFCTGPLPCRVHMHAMLSFRQAGDQNVCIFPSVLSNYCGHVLATSLKEPIASNSYFLYLRINFFSGSRCCHSRFTCMPWLFNHGVSIYLTVLHPRFLYFRYAMHLCIVYAFH